MSQDYTITQSDELDKGGAKTKARANIAAIRLLKTLESEDRQATRDEQAVLVKFSGWGTLADLFTGKPEWADLQTELRSITSEQEYAAARAAILNAHYTDPVVAGAIYQGLEHLGFHGGRILDPSMGANGVFEGVMPQPMRLSSELVGVELDSLSGRIAQQLYPDATVYVRDFKDVIVPDDYFDLAVSNVPFSEVGVADSRYAGLPIDTLHDYFFAKSLDKVRPGGLVAFLTSTGTMQSRSGEPTREYLSDRANLVGAIRLPSDAFRQMAGTEVTTDLIILQKRGDGIPNNGIAWTSLQPSSMLGEDGEALPVNEYYAQRPELMLGTLRDDKLYPGRLALQGDGRDLAGAIAQALQSFPANTYQEAPDRSDVPVVMVPPELQDRVRYKGFAFYNNQLYQRSEDVLEPVEIEGKKRDRICGMLEVRDAVKTVFDVQLMSNEPDALKMAQAKLNQVYDKFVAAHGPLHNRGNTLVFQKDADHRLLLALEDYDEQTKTATKTAIFSDRTIAAYQPKDHADSPKEALLYSLGEKGKIDLPYIAQLVSSSEQEAITSLQRDRLIFFDPQQQNWQPEDEYLSGNVKQKLDEARTAAASDPQFEINVEALEAVQPELVPPGDIEVRLASAWVPPSDVAMFVQDLLKTSEPIDVRYSKSLGMWTVDANWAVQSSVNNLTTYGTNRVDALRLIELALNLKDPVVYDRDDDRLVKNAEESTAARLKQEEIKVAFKDWVWLDPDRTDRLTQRYNDTFNNHRPRQYNGAHLELPGSNPQIELRPHQKDAAWRSLHGNTLLAHACGAGKTFTMIASAMEKKRLGLANKPMLVVPNHLLEQFAGDFKLLYPNANILAATKEDSKAENRQELMSRIATGNWDAVIVTHSAFGKLKLDRKAQEGFYNERIKQFDEEINDLEASDAPASRRMVKELERSKKRLEAKIDALYEGKGKDEAVTFEQLGVDQLYVDEAHYFKNLGFQTKMYGVAGLPNTQSDRAFDLYMKARYLAETHGEGKGLVLATGTPIANTMAELYIMQSFLQPKALEKAGVAEFDDWASTFGETVTAPEISPAGQYKVKTRFSRFVNVPELMNVFRQVADIQTSEMLNLPVPTLKTGQAEVVPCAASDIQLAFVENLAERAEKISGGQVKPDEDNMLLITTEGRKASIDMRLIHPSFPDDPNSKVNQFVNDAIEFYEQTEDTQSTHLVFCDLGTPKEGAGSKRTTEVDVVERFSIYQDIKQKLIDRGMPAEKIAFVQDYKTDAKKLELQQKFSTGEIHLLISGAQLEVGFNGQKKLARESHINPPWRPDQIEQRDGRILRQGNENAEVEIKRYVTQGRNNRPSFDAYSYQTLETKKRAIAQIMSGKSDVRSVEDVSDAAMTYAEVKAIATGNPLIMEKASVDNQVSQLSMLKKSHLNGQYRVQQQIQVLPHQIDDQTQKVESLRKDTANLPEVTEQTFGKLSKDQQTDTLTLRMVSVDLINADPKIDPDSPREIGRHLLESAARKQALGTREPESIGRVGTFDIILKRDWDEVNVHVRGNGTDYFCAKERSFLNTYQNLVDLFDNRIASSLTSSERHLNKLKAEFKDLSENFEPAPFAKEAELAAAIKRQKEINTALGLNKDNAVATEESIESQPKVEREDSAEIEVMETDVVAKSQSRDATIKSLLASAQVPLSIAPAHQQDSVVSEAVCELLEEAGLEKTVTAADSFELNIQNFPYPALHLSRSGDDLSLTQTIEQEGEAIVERQVSFTIALDGKLEFQSIQAIEPELSQWENEEIAQDFCTEWLSQGYGVAARSTWQMQQQVIQPSLFDGVEAIVSGAVQVHENDAVPLTAAPSVVPLPGDIENASPSQEVAAVGQLISQVKQSASPAQSSAAEPIAPQAVVDRSQSVNNAVEPMGALAEERVAASTHSSQPSKHDRGDSETIEPAINPEPQVTQTIDPVRISDLDSLKSAYPSYQFSSHRLLGGKSDLHLSIYDSDGGMAGTINLTQSGSPYGYQAAAEQIDRHERRRQHPDLVALRQEFPELRFETRVGTSGLIVAAIEKESSQRVRIGQLANSEGEPTPVKLQEFREALHEKGYGSRVEAPRLGSTSAESDRLPIADAVQQLAQLPSDILEPLRQHLPKSVEYTKTITRAMVQDRSDAVFLFGDNLEGTGLGGQAQAMRGEPNAIGIPTKHRPDRDASAYFSDADLPTIKPALDARIEQVKVAIEAGKTIVVPSAGLGTGLAMLPQKAPAVYDYLQQQLGKFGIDIVDQALDAQKPVHDETGVVLEADFDPQVLAEPEMVLTDPEAIALRNLERSAVHQETWNQVVESRVQQFFREAGLEVANADVFQRSLQSLAEASDKDGMYRLPPDLLQPSGASLHSQLPLHVHVSQDAVSLTQLYIDPHLKGDDRIATQLNFLRLGDLGLSLNSSSILGNETLDPEGAASCLEAWNKAGFPQRLQQQYGAAVESKLNAIDVTVKPMSEVQPDAIAKDVTAQMPQPSPFMADYEAAQAQHPDKLVLAQIGRFYAVLGNDAAQVSQKLDVPLSSRPYSDLDVTARIAMASFPVARAPEAIAKLERSGLQVVVSEVAIGVPPQPVPAIAKVEHVAKAISLSQQPPIDAVPAEPARSRVEPPTLRAMPASVAPTPPSVEAIEPAKPEKFSPSLEQMREWMASAQSLERPENYQNRILQLAGEMLKGTSEAQKPREQRDPSFCNPKFALSENATAAMQRDIAQAQDMSLSKASRLIVQQGRETASGQLIFERPNGDYRLTLDRPTDTLTIYSRHREQTLLVDRAGAIDHEHSRVTDQDVQTFKAFTQRLVQSQAEPPRKMVGVDR